MASEMLSGEKMVDGKISVCRENILINRETVRDGKISVCRENILVNRETVRLNVKP